MPIRYTETYRMTPAPARDLPLGVHTAGHYRITPPFTSCVMHLRFIHLYWCARGEGLFEFGGRDRALKRNQIAIYYPGMRHYYYASESAWELYWLTLDGPLAVSLLAAFGLDAGIYDAGPAPAGLFQTILRLVRQPTRSAEIQVCAAAFTLLTRAAGSRPEPADDLVNAAVGRMHEAFVRPDLNVKTLAAALGVQRAPLSARFRQAIGITPGAYIDRLRLQQALSLLQHTNLPIAVIAARCGYADAHYFSRVIRRVTGRPPVQFRRHNRAEACREHPPARARSAGRERRRSMNHPR